MKKLMYAVVLIGIFGLALTGCRAEGEIDPDDHSSISAPR
jgi:hypothetical protein